VTMDPGELERRVDDTLRGLPAPRAPRTLLPRVMAAVEARVNAGGPVGHPWFAWAPMWQAASLAIGLVLVAGAAIVWASAGAWLPAVVPESVQVTAQRAGAATDVVADFAYAFQLVWRAVVAPIAKVLLMFTLVLCAACALFAAALGRIALGGASHS
jgi:hypothetical protein